MQIKRFEADTMPKALDLVKNAFGPQAVILSVKSGKKHAGIFRTFRKPRVEIVAAVDTQPGQTISRVTRHAQGSSIEWTDPADTPKAPAVVKKFSGYPYGDIRVEKVSDRSPLFLPRTYLRGLFSIHRQMILQGVNETQSCRLIGRAHHEASKRNMIASANLKTLLAEILNEIHPSKHCLEKHSGEPQVIALLGPNGSGKTTTLSKLALAYRYRLKKNVALVSLDNATIGGISKLSTAAKIMGIPAVSAANAVDLKQLIRRFHDFDVILVDTPGVSPGNTGDRETLKSSLEGIRTLETHLVLSATDKEKDLAAAVKRFESFDINWMIFTKLDVSEEKGTVLNQIMQFFIPISYVTFGTRIQGDISRGTPDKLIELIFRGEKENRIWAAPPETLAGQLDAFEDLLRNMGIDLQRPDSFVEESFPGSDDQPERLTKKRNNVISPIRFHQGRLH